SAGVRVGRGSDTRDHEEQRGTMSSSPLPPTRAEPIAPGPGSGKAALRRRRGPAGLAPFSSVAYRYLFVGTALTMTGYFMQVVGQGWLIYDLTGSPTWLGIVSFASGIPLLVLALPAGVVVDRFDRRAVLIA